MWPADDEAAVTLRVPKDTVEIDAIGGAHWHGAHLATLTIRAASGAYGSVPLGYPIDRQRIRPSPKDLLPSGDVEIERKDVARIVRGTMGLVAVTKDGHLVRGEEAVPDLDDVIDAATTELKEAICVVRRDGVTLPEPPLL